MEKEKLKLIVRNLELLVDSLKAEIYSDPSAYKPKEPMGKRPILDYDEVSLRILNKMTRAKELIKLLERLIKQDHLYTQEKIIEMKQQLRSLKEELSELEAQTSKGFGKK
jgi:hypothetical protein